MWREHETCDCQGRPNEKILRRHVVQVKKTETENKNISNRGFKRENTEKQKRIDVYINRG